MKVTLTAKVQWHPPTTRLQQVVGACLPPPSDLPAPVRPLIKAEIFRDKMVTGSGHFWTRTSLAFTIQRRTL
ncbi:MAG: hypothetical protein C7B46_01735 [Sulfobacillus benefaciens]|uniref:Uncharacterized protein n=1 Tax=Sulfobacillus benefaciens TaxID=453960 RepID=A0A2T2XKY0_9FIRM|nr:MAG: hypothetical protein C7B46_01735 [Sulfobacillus benefaciens]